MVENVPLYAYTTRDLTPEETTGALSQPQRTI